jgi:hypothetical protein
VSSDPEISRDSIHNYNIVRINPKNVRGIQDSRETRYGIPDSLAALMLRSSEAHFFDNQSNDAPAKNIPTKLTIVNILSREMERIKRKS